jgi:hypothetical protein
MTSMVMNNLRPQNMMLSIDQVEKEAKKVISQAEKYEERIEK